MSDPDPRGDWKVFYRFHNGGGHIDYWNWQRNKRRSEIESQPLDCTAVGAQVERLSIMWVGESSDE